MNEASDCIRSTGLAIIGDSFDRAARSFFAAIMRTKFRSAAARTSGVLCGQLLKPPQPRALALGSEWHDDRGVLVGSTA